MHSGWKKIPFFSQNLQVVSLPKETHGKFFNGDAYIIYSCSEYGEAGGSDVKPRRNESTKLEQHIHFWIGEKASQDEATVAAYKTVELDDLLSGAPIQHREVQGHESHRFKSYFKNGIRIMVNIYWDFFELVFNLCEKCHFPW